MEKYLNEDDIYIIEPEGRLIQEETDLLEDLLNEIYDEDPGARIVVDLSLVSQVSSGVLGVLVTSKRRLSAEGGEIRLVINNDDLLQLFETTMLDKVFEIHDLKEAAIAAF